MTNEQLKLLLDQLNRIIKQSKADNEKGIAIAAHSIDIRHRGIYTAVFCSVAALISKNLLDFDTAKKLYEEALERNKIDQTIDEEGYGELQEDLVNINNNGYRRFTVYQKNPNAYNTPQSALEELEKVIQEGYENADVWGIIGAGYVDLGQNDKAIEPFKKCLELDRKTQELLPKYRKFAKDFLKSSKIEVAGTKKSGCFIATAVYNSHSAPEVVILREFRDQVLLHNLAGKAFVMFYYLISPRIADFISKSNLLKRWAKALIDSIVKFITRDS